MGSQYANPACPKTKVEKKQSACLKFAFASGDPFTKFQVIVLCRAAFVILLYLPAIAIRVNWACRKGVQAPAEEK
jgi:hypothetical protein